MKISHIRISNLLGIDSLEFDAGQFTAVCGTNGQGKTSVLEAIKHTLRAGHDATILREGAEQGEAVLILDDGRTIAAKVTEAGTTRKITDAAGKAVAKPGTVLAQLTDLLSVNPVEFLTARPADRARALLEAMPLEADAAELSRITGIDVQPQPGKHALAVVDGVRQQVYDDRTGTNRAVREKEATINQLRAAMPAAPGGAEGDEASHEAAIATAEAAHAATGAKIDAQLARYRAEHDAKMDELRAAMDAEKQRFADVEARARGAREKAAETRAAAVSPAREALAAIRANRDAAARRQATLATIATMEKQLAELQHDAERQSAALAAVDQYKLDLLSSLPIPGLEVRDGAIYRDGVAFDRLNTAQRVQIAVEVAKLRAGELGAICVDGLEALDSATWAEFKQAAIASGLQFFVTRVTDSAFQITTEP